MLVTESDALHMWCPFARIVEVDGETGQLSPTYNRFKLDGDSDPHAIASGVETRCLGSECMAWRWDTAMRVGKRRGYCGLAGRPRGLGPEE